MQRLSFIVFVVLLLSFACEKEVLNDEVKLAVEDNIVLFQPENGQVVLSKIFTNNEILVFGETHYVQEHQEFIVSLLPALHAHGYRIIFDELVHCFTWMVEDYINGDIESLPGFIMYFNAELVEGIKQYNQMLDESERMQLIYMDVNHWKSNFVTALVEIEKILGPQTVFSEIKNSTVDSESYVSELITLIELIDEQYDQYVAIWGEKWYSRIRDIVEVEMVSSNYRIHRNDQDREMMMYQNVTNILEHNPGIKALVNTGMYHAQKETYMGNSIQKLSELLLSQNPNTYTIAFVGMEGEIKKRFDDNGNVPVNLPGYASKDNIIRQINELAGSNMSYLPLEAPVFTERNIIMSYDYGTTIKAPLGRQFDGIITYPTIHTLESMELYDYR